VCGFALPNKLIEMANILSDDNRKTQPDILPVSRHNRTSDVRTCDYMR